MRKVLFGFIVLSLMATTVAAFATGPITRTGDALNGSRNPGGCEVYPDAGTELHVKCTEKAGATGGAFVRYRFLRDVGAVRGDASVSADIVTFVGDPDRCTVVRWMGPVRTLRIHVLHGCYVHIRSVTWEQSGF